ncbi:unnamed protein product [Clavelina lepadiformis]|uniref:Dihydroorotate dehydrogenase (quinone), mitochondrial n=1 Tax=Clavelina lepadiformis TaxID=159417 RepID=A0ABP0H3E2_CLALP
MGSLLQSTALVWGGLGIFCAVETYRGNPKFYATILMPSLQSLCSPENAHKLAVKFLRRGWIPPDKTQDDPILKTTVFNKTFINPVGIAAGFDKHAEAMAGLEKIGFGLIEVGSVTPLPQKGNAKPRVFRLPEDGAVINRYGFNSCGHEIAANRLKIYTSSGPRNVVLGVNLGKNKTSKSTTEDYVKGVQALGCYADYIVVNVSSPNTPGLRKLQSGDQLEGICDSVLQARDKLPNKPPVLIKIAPDLNDQDVADIAKVVVDRSVDGLIISNTTVQRPDHLISSSKTETGGLSGVPLHEMSTELIRKMYRLTKGRVPIVGVGGIANGFDAYEKIRAGASLVQLYTSLIYQGTPIVGVIKSQLTYLLKRDGFANVSDAVGVDCRD